MRPALRSGGGAGFCPRVRPAYSIWHLSSYLVFTNSFDSIAKNPKFQVFFISFLCSGSNKKSPDISGHLRLSTPKKQGSLRVHKGENQRALIIYLFYFLVFVAKSRAHRGPLSQNLKIYLIACLDF